MTGPTPAPRKRAATKKPTAKKTATARKKTPTVHPEQPWDRQPDESNPAWEAFRIYRDMGLTRSLTKVAAEVGKSTTLLGRWSKRHTWPLRTSAYDKDVDRQWQLTMKEERDKANRRNARIAARAMAKVESAMDFLVFEDAGEVARMMDTATKVEARALQIGTETNVRVSGPGGGPVEVDSMVSMLSDEDRRARMLQLRQELERREAEAGLEAAEAS